VPPELAVVPLATRHLRPTPVRLAAAEDAGSAAPGDAGDAGDGTGEHDHALGSSAGVAAAVGALHYRSGSFLGEVLLLLDPLLRLRLKVRRSG